MNTIDCRILYSIPEMKPANFILSKFPRLLFDLSVIFAYNSTSHVACKIMEWLKLSEMNLPEYCNCHSTEPRLSSRI